MKIDGRQSIKILDTLLHHKNGRRELNLSRIIVRLRNKSHITEISKIIQIINTYSLSCDLLFVHDPSYHLNVDLKGTVKQ